MLTPQKEPTCSSKKCRHTDTHTPDQQQRSMYQVPRTHKILTQGPHIRPSPEKYMYNSLACTKERGTHTDISVSGIYKYGRNTEGKLKRCIVTHTPQCSAMMSTRAYIVFDLQFNNKRYVKFPSNTTSLHPQTP